MAPAAERIREIAFDCGFDLVRFGPADPGPDGQRFLKWLDAGRHGEMQYLAANRDRILNPDTWRSGVRSAIALAVDYGGLRHTWPMAPRSPATPAAATTTAGCATASFACAPR